MVVFWMVNPLGAVVRGAWEHYLEEVCAINPYLRPWMPLWVPPQER